MRQPQAYKQETSLSSAIRLRYASGSVSGASNASPIVITATSHGLVTGDHVHITGVGGNTAANGSFTITKIDANSFSLDGSTGNGTYTSGGTWDAVPARCKFAIIQAETQSVRWRDDGTAPTASVGMVVAAGSSVTFSGASVYKARIIETTASAKLNVSFYLE